MGQAQTLSPATATVPAHASVTVTKVDAAVTPGCGAHTVTFSWTLTGANPGETADIQLLGPGVPGQTQAVVGSGGTLKLQLPTSGAGQWTAILQKVGGAIVAAAAGTGTGVGISLTC